LLHPPLFFFPLLNTPSRSEKLSPSHLAISSSTGSLRNSWAIQEALAKRALLPSEHFLDSGYVDADVLVKSQRHLGLEIIGPMRPDSSWQAKAGQGYDLSHFTIDWQTQRVTCPEAQAQHLLGRTSG
jgi:hypothetical protein